MSTAYAARNTLIDRNDIARPCRPRMEMANAKRSLVTGETARSDVTGRLGHSAKRLHLFFLFVVLTGRGEEASGFHFEDRRADRLQPQMIAAIADGAVGELGRELPTRTCHGRSKLLRVVAPDAVSTHRDPTLPMRVGHLIFEMFGFGCAGRFICLLVANCGLCLTGFDACIETLRTVRGASDARSPGALDEEGR